MMRWRSAFLSALLIVTFFSFAGPAAAARLIADDNVTISESADDDLYISGGEVEVSADVDGDVVVAGGSIRIQGNVSGDLFVAGGTVIVEGDIGHTARVVGGTVDFRGRIGRDILAAGGTVIVGAPSKVGGDVLAAGGTFRTSGSINGDVAGGFGNAEFNGPVLGNVDITVDRLSFAQGARIKGNVDYRSANRAKLDPRARISGKVVKHKPPAQVTPAARVLTWLWSLASMIVIGLVIAWLFPQSLKLTRESLASQPWASLGVGFAAMILVPVAVIMMMFTLIGLPLALICLGFYVLAIYLAQIYGAAALGSMVLDRGGEKWVGAGAVLGIAVLSIVRLIPVLGGMVGFFLILFALGAMTIAGWRASRPTGGTP